MTIFLCGLPMCGKSTVGQSLALFLKTPFIETDRMIEEAYQNHEKQHLSCREIVRCRGEPFFRQIEKEQVRKLKKTPEGVVALGGGSLSDLETAKMISDLGVLVYLKVRLELLWGRTALCGVPAYLDSSNPQEAFYQMANKRMPIFESFSQMTVDANKSPKDVTRAIIAGLAAFSPT